MDTLNTHKTKGVNDMLIFESIASALANGFQVWDKTDEGFLVRRKGSGGLFEMALVIYKVGAPIAV